MKLAQTISTPLSQKHHQQLLEAAKALNVCRFTEAELKLQEILTAVGDSADLYRFVVLHWMAKLYYQKGEFNKTISTTAKLGTLLQDSHPALKEEALPESVPADVAFLYVRCKYVQAKSLHKIKEYVKAEEICNYIISAQKDSTQGPQPFWKYSVKACYIKSKQMQNCMEFPKAGEILEEEAKPILIELIKAFGNQGEVDESKELADNPYSFTYRKKFAGYRRKFAFYSNAVSLFKSIFADEAKHYFALEAVNLESEEEFSDLKSRVPSDKAADCLKQEEFILKPKQIPHLRVKETLYQLGKAVSFQLNTPVAVSHFKKCEQLISEVFGGAFTMHLPQVLNACRDSNLKTHTPRNTEALSESEKFAKRTQEAISAILEDSPNYIVAKYLVGMGDVRTEMKEIEAATTCYHRAQTIIGEKYSETHPVILAFNSNLIEIYSATEDPGKKRQCIQICERNLEIANKTYGETSIYALKWQLAMASNSVAAMKIQQAQEHVAKMRVIVQKFHDDDPRSLANQFMFLGQVMIAMTLMNSTAADSAERILSYVYQKQLEYCENYRQHPFLEQTVINLALHFRQNQQLATSLQMWEQLRRIQEEMYGFDKEVLVYTYKNIGICYMGLGLPEKSEEFYLKALSIMEIQKSLSTGDEEQFKEDSQQIASIYFNLYLSSVSNDCKEKAKEYNLKNMEMNKQIYGAESLNVSNNCFIQAQLCLKTSKIEESVQWMRQSLEIFNKLDTDQLKKDEQLLIKVRYLLALGNIYYIKGQFQDAQGCIKEALEICQNERNFTYETVEDMKKLLGECRKMVIKCEAKMKNVSALDLKPLDSEEDSLALARPVPLGAALGLFGLVTSSSFLLSYLYLKHKH